MELTQPRHRPNVGQNCVSGGRNGADFTSSRPPGVYLPNIGQARVNLNSTVEDALTRPLTALAQEPENPCFQAFQGKVMCVFYGHQKLCLPPPGPFANTRKFVWCGGHPFLTKTVEGIPLSGSSSIFELVAVVQSYIVIHVIDLFVFNLTEG